MSRRGFLRFLLGAGGLAATPFALRAYARHVEPRILVTEQVAVQSPRIPAALDGVRIGVLSDFHLGNGVDEVRIEQSVAQLNALKPDIALLGGDYIHRWGLGTKAAYALRNLFAPLGVFAVLGNHDYWNNPRQISQALHEQFAQASFPFKLMRNESYQLNINDIPLHIVGVDDVTLHKHDFAKAVQGLPKNEAAILLVHEPDIADEAATAHPFALQVSGHSHGGQIRIPFVYPWWTPTWARKYISGLMTVNEMQLYVTRGIGMSWMPMRFLCPPEVTLITLRA
jgi:uncharacterized protein